MLHPFDSVKDVRAITVEPYDSGWLSKIHQIKRILARRDVLGRRSKRKLVEKMHDTLLFLSVPSIG